MSMPDEVEKPGRTRGIRIHDKTTKRLLTDAEAATGDADKAEQTQKAQQAQQRQPTTAEDELIGIDPIISLVGDDIAVQIRPPAPSAAPPAPSAPLRCRQRRPYGRYYAPL